MMIEKKSMTMRLFSNLAVLIFLGFSCGCASQQTIDEEKPLPFHLAVIPATRNVLQPVVLTTTSEQGDLLDIRFDLGTHELSDAIVTSLDGDAFLKATLLSYPEGLTPEAFAKSYLPLQRSDYWSSQAREVGADMLMSCNLEYDARITGGSNEWFWINHLIFLFGGVFAWLPDDRSYFVNGTLDANLYDSSFIFRNPRSLGEAEAGIIPLACRFDEVTLDFLNRASGIGTFALGTFLPSGWFATQNQTVKENLESEILKAITTDLVRSVRDRAREINEAENLVDFYLDLASVEAKRVQGEVAFAGEVILRSGRGVPRLEGFVLQLGDTVIQKDFSVSDRVLDEDLTQELEQGGFLVYRYRVEETLAPDPSSQSIKLILVQGGQFPGRRSYTFPVE